MLTTPKPHLLQRHGGPEVFHQWQDEFETLLLTRPHAMVALQEMGGLAAQLVHLCAPRAVLASLSSGFD